MIISQKKKWAEKHKNCKSAQKKRSINGQIGEISNCICCRLFSFHTVVTSFFLFFNSSHVFSTIKRLLSSLMNYNRPLLRHVDAPLFSLADQKLLRRQQKPLSQVTGVVNNPVCDPGGFLWGCCLQLIRCEASCSAAVRAAGRAMSALVRRRGGREMDFKSVVSLRAVWGCDTSVNSSKTHIVTCRTDEQSSAGGFWRRRVADVCL